MDYDVDGGLSGKDVMNRASSLGNSAANAMSSAASNTMSKFKSMNAKYSNIDTFKNEVDLLKERRSTMFVSGSFYVLRTSWMVSLLLVIGVMLVFSLIYSNGDITGKKGYLTSAPAVISLVTALVICTEFLTLMLLGKQVAVKTIASLT